MDNNPKSNEAKDKNIKNEKRDQKKQPEKKEKTDNKQHEKVDRPVKLAKNKHSFVVAGK